MNIGKPINQIVVAEETIKPNTELTITESITQLAEAIINSVDEIHYPDENQPSNEVDAWDFAEELVSETLTVESIGLTPAGTELEVTTKYNPDSPTQIQKFAIENLLNDGAIKKTSN